jgi:hypothetical protein
VYTISIIYVSMCLNKSVQFFSRGSLGDVPEH